jgi:hypothetical protein
MPGLEGQVAEGLFTVVIEEGVLGQERSGAGDPIGGPSLPARLERDLQLRRDEDAGRARVEHLPQASPRSEPRQVKAVAGDDQIETRDLFGRDVLLRPGDDPGHGDARTDRFVPEVVSHDLGRLDDGDAAAKPRQRDGQHPAAATDVEDSPARQHDPRQEILDPAVVIRMLEPQPIPGGVLVPIGNSPDSGMNDFGLRLWHGQPGFERIVLKGRSIKARALQVNGGRHRAGLASAPGD